MCNIAEDFEFSSLGADERHILSSNLSELCFMCLYF